MSTVWSLRAGPVPVLVAALVLAAGCATGDGLAGLSIATTGSTAPAVGEAVPLVIRAIYDDGSTVDVTGQSACVLQGDPAVGELADVVFVARAPGAITVVCTYADVRGTLAIDVAGVRSVTIAHIQRGDVASGADVELEGIVFAVAPDAEYTDFWIQDPGGGVYSGIYVRDGRAAGSPPVVEGDQVRIVGVTGERSGRSVIELEEVTPVTTATPTVDIVAIDDLDPALWDGCLVSITDVVVTNPDVDGYTWEVAAVDDPDGASMLIETLLYDPRPDTGEVFARISGPLFPFLTADETPAAAIVPRRAADTAVAAGSR